MVSCSNTFGYRTSPNELSSGIKELNKDTSEVGFISAASIL